MGPLIILSGPSGGGKSTVIARLRERTQDVPLHLSVSATTREPRIKGDEIKEQDGVNYHFWTREKFEQELKAGAFLEWAEVYGNYYGTLRSEVEPYRERGVGILLEIDVQGAAKVREQCPDAVSIFLRAPSEEEYERRLRKRGTEREAVIQRRLAAARDELEHIQEYDHIVVNDDVDHAVSELQGIIRKQFGR